MTKKEYVEYLKASLKKLNELMEDDDLRYDLEHIVNIASIMQFQFTLVQEIYQVSGED